MEIYVCLLYSMQTVSACHLNVGVGAGAVGIESAMTYVMDSTIVKADNILANRQDRNPSRGDWHSCDWGHIRP